MQANDWKLKDGRFIRLITPDQLKKLDKGTVLYDIMGGKSTVGNDPIDDDTRFGYLAYGELINAD